MLPPFDLSMVTEVKGMEFRCHTIRIQWLTMSLRTVKPPNLRQITLTMDPFIVFFGPVGEEIHQEWQDLDHLLVQLWTSHSVLPIIRFETTGNGDHLLNLASGLLPELTSRGAVSVIEDCFR